MYKSVIIGICSTFDEQVPQKYETTEKNYTILRVIYRKLYIIVLEEISLAERD